MNSNSGFMKISHHLVDDVGFFVSIYDVGEAKCRNMSNDSKTITWK